MEDFVSMLGTFRQALDGLQTGLTAIIVIVALLAASVLIGKARIGFRILPKVRK